RQGKDFSRRVTPLFETMLIQHPAEVGEDETIHEERGDRVGRAATTTASLDAEQDSGTINRTQSTAIPNEHIPQGTGSGGSPRRQDTILGDIPAQTRFERLSKQSHKPPLSRVNTLRSEEDSMQLMELMELYTKLSARVLALENNNTAQDLEIIHLKKRVKRLEKKRKSRTPRLKRRLFKVRIESSTEKSLGDQEDASNQGRNDQDKGISFVQEDAETQERYGHDIEVNIASTSITTASINLTIVEPVTTISVPVTTVGVSVSTVEPKKEERMARHKEEDANIVEWDDVQAMMDAYHELVERLQAEEQGELSIEERSKLFVELMNKRKKHFTRVRTEEKRRKPPTKAQKRNQNVVEGSGKKAKSSGKEAVSKKRTEEELDQESSKRQKTSESSELAKEPRDKEADELSQEELQQMMIIVPE
nr:hypothetical protein [Tanacetum cinerariifolium]